MKNWIVSKTFSKTAVRSDWTLNMNVNMKQLNDFNTKSKKNKKYERIRIRFFCHSVNCQSSDRKLWIVRNQTFDIENNWQWNHQIMFFWVIHEIDFQIFNANWLWIEKNNWCEDHDNNDFFKSKNSMRKSRSQWFFKSACWMRKSRWQCFFKLSTSTYKYTSLKISLRNIRKNLDHFKKLRC